MIVQDNLNTYHPASLYKAFPPGEARRILQRLEFCYTPKHGSWLNRAEIELSVLSRRCLDRRIPDIDTLRKEVFAWEERRNFVSTWVDWRFTTKDARIKLKRLYPSIQDRSITTLFPPVSCLLPFFLKFERTLSPRRKNRSTRILTVEKKTKDCRGTQ